MEMERQEKAQLLRAMEGLPAWRLYQAHLEELCRRKEVEKSLALRGNDSFKSMKLQFEIDGINLSVKSLNNLATSLSQQVETSI